MPSSSRLIVVLVVLIVELPLAQSRAEADSAEKRELQAALAKLPHSTGLHRATVAFAIPATLLLVGSSFYAWAHARRPRCGRHD